MSTAVATSRVEPTNLETIYSQETTHSETTYPKPHPVQSSHSFHPDTKISSGSRESQFPSRSEFLRTYGYDTSDHDWVVNVQTNVRQRLRLWAYHVLWVCKNIVNMESMKSRKDIVILTSKDIARLEDYAHQMIKQLDKGSAKSVRPSKSDRSDGFGGINEILRILHVLESVMVREYITPMLTLGYVQHLQTIGKSFTQPHWALQSRSDQLKMEELSEYIILLYHCIVTVLKFIDIDIHSSLYYQCTKLIQKYHSLARTSSTMKSFYSNYIAFVQETKDMLDVFQQTAQYGNLFYVPRTILSVWQQDLQLVLRMLDLYSQ